ALAAVPLTCKSASPESRTTAVCICNSGVVTTCTFRRTRLSNGLVCGKAVVCEVRARYAPKSKPGVIANLLIVMSPERVEALDVPSQCRSASAVELTPGG